jgi:phosphohistidine swiveling domain-containing protein
VDRALERVAALRGVDAVQAARLVGLVEAVGAELVGRSLLPRREAIWRFSGDQVRAMIGAMSAAPGRLARTGPDRWELFTMAVASLRGRPHQGEAAVGGLGGGRPCAVLSRREVERFRPRDVLIAPYPESWLAPLLWSASGLVTTGGGTGAHLIEVAHWLRVPAVVGCRLEESGEVDAERFDGVGALVAVDGDAGVVSVVERDD